jgi:hypothetical protein
MEKKEEGLPSRNAFNPVSLQGHDSFRVADHPEGGQTSQYKGVCQY